MYQEAKDSYVAKFDSPFTAWLYQQSLDGTDEEAGDVQFGLWAGRIGRRVLCEDGQGFVWQTRYVTEEQASEFVATVDSMDESVW